MRRGSALRPWLCFSLVLLAAKAAAVAAAGAGAPSFGGYGLNQDRVSGVDGADALQQRGHSTLVYPTLGMGTLEGTYGNPGEAPTLTSSEKLAAVRRAVRGRLRLKKAALQTALMLVALYAFMRLMGWQEDASDVEKGEKAKEKEEEAADINKAKAAARERLSPKPEPAKEKSAAPASADVKAEGSSPGLGRAGPRCLRRAHRASRPWASPFCALGGRRKPTTIFVVLPLHALESTSAHTLHALSSQKFVGSD
ncbi:hypothetical protein Esti_000564 [Eimeria stiedai]